MGAIKDLLIKAKEGHRPSKKIVQGLMDNDNRNSLRFQSQKKRKKANKR